MEDSAREIAQKVQQGIFADFHNPRYYNIKWLEMLVEIKAHLDRMGTIF